MYVERERERERKGFFNQLKSPRRKKRWRVECVRRIPSPNSCALTHSKKEHEGRKKKKKTIEGMLEWDPQMLAYIPPITTRTYLRYRFQWSICSFSLSLSTWHHPPKEELWFPLFFFYFFPTCLDDIFIWVFSHQKPQWKKKKTKFLGVFLIVVQWETIVFIKDGLWEICAR